MAVTGIASFTVLFSTRVRRRQAQAQAHWDGLKPENRDGGLLRAQVAARTVSGGARARITANAGRIDGNDERLARMEADQVQMETRLVRVETRIEGMFELLLGAVTAAGLHVPSVVDTVPMRRLTLVRDEDAS